MPRYKTYNSKSRTQSISFIWDASVQAYRLNLSWDGKTTENIISVIKGFIPSGERDYDPSTKTWWVKESYFEGIKKVILTYYPNAHVVEKSDETWQSNFGKSSLPSETDLTFKFTKLISEAEILPPALPCPAIRWEFIPIQKLYRKAALFYHPDRNPDFASKMSELNETWTLLKQIYFKL